MRDEAEQLVTGELPKYKWQLNPWEFHTAIRTLCKLIGFPSLKHLPAVVMISISTLDVFPGYPRNTGIVEAEPFSIHRILDIGTVMTKVSCPHMGNHSKELVLSSKLEGHKAQNYSPIIPPFLTIV